MPARASTGQFRRFRMTASGTYLAPYLQMGKVVEYDKKFKESGHKIPSPWAAIRLHNGNTLITDERDKLTREVNPQGRDGLEDRTGENQPAAEHRFPGFAKLCPLANGNTAYAPGPCGPALPVN